MSPEQLEDLAQAVRRAYSTSSRGGRMRQMFPASRHPVPTMAEPPEVILLKRVCMR
jgi:hypothetical protein